MDLTLGFFTSTLGIVIVRTPFSIFRKPKLPQELAAATLHSMPRLFLLFLLHFPLSAYLEHSVIFNFDLYFLFLKPRKISFEHMRFWGLLPIHAGINQIRSFSWKLRFIWEWEVLKRVPNLKREWVQDVGSAATKEAWNQWHLNKELD